MGVRSRFWILDTPESRSGCMQMHIDGKEQRRREDKKLLYGLLQDLISAKSAMNLCPLMI
jgi:hypothetical protein